MGLGEKTLEEKTLYKGKILDLELHRVLLPDGRETKREVVRHRPAVGIVALQDRCVFLVRQFRYPLFDFTLEIPAGMIEDGESPLDAASREIQEEIGYKALCLQEIGRIYPSPGYCDEEVFLFLASDLIPSKLSADDDEFIDVVKCPFAKALDLLKDGTIQDGKSSLALYRMAYEGKITDN